MFSGYFHSLSLLDLLVLVAAYLTFDSLGSFFGKLFKLPEFTRLFWWVVGLSFYSFFWWLFLKSSFNPMIIIVSWIIFFFAGLYFFIKSPNLLNAWRSEWLLLIPLSLFSVALFIKVSLPPYWGDEIGYHYYSPIETLRPDLTLRRPNIYFFLPQSLDNIYRLTFAVSKSYSVPRIIHLLIVLSGLATVAKWLRNHAGRLTSNMWLISAPLLTVNFTSMATSGLVDMATAASVLVALTLNWEFLVKRDWKFFAGVVAIWATSLGFKYSALVPMTSSAIVSFLFLATKKDLKPIITKSISSLPWFLAFGGFWLLRNFLLKGDPIYPILGSSGFFTGWTIPIDLQSIPLISIELFTGSRILRFALAAAAVYLAISFRKLNKIHLLLLLSFAIEILIVKKLGGFLIRYYFHWAYLAGMVMLIPLSVNSKLKYLYLTILSLILVLQTSYTMRFVYSSEFAPKVEQNYAFQKITIVDWLKERYPSNAAIALECSELSTNPKAIYVLDPHIMWFTANSQIQGFFVGCYFKFFDLSFPQQSNLPATNTNFLLYSVHGCQDEAVIPTQLRESMGDHESRNYPFAITQRKLNNRLVCEGKMLIPDLYEVPANVLIDQYSKIQQ